MPRWRAALRLISGFVSALPTMAGAQVGEPASTERLAKATADQPRIRIRLTSGQEVELRSHTVVANRLRGLPEGAVVPVEYSLSDVDRVWRRGSAATTGLMIGAAIGVVAGAVGGAAAAEFCPFSLGGGCAYPSDAEQVRMGVAGAAVGALIGGALGAAIAAPIRRWKTVYERGMRVTPVVSTNRLGVALAFKTF